MQYYAIRYHGGEYGLEQVASDGTVYKQIVARDTINPALRVRLDANRGVRVDAQA